MPRGFSTGGRVRTIADVQAAADVIAHVLPVPEGRAGRFYGYPIHDGATPRPYIEDEAGRRWLLDGSGEAA